MLKAVRILLPGIYLIILAFVSGMPKLHAQNPPVEIKKSTEKVLMAGNEYLIHTVGQGHTLYSICRVYNITEEEMERANPGAKSGLFVGQVLKIPVPKQAPVSESKFVKHTIQPGETTYFLSRKYNLPIDRIYEFNPDAVASVKPGQVILIPREYIGETLRQPLEKSDEPIRHTVAPRETPFRVAQIYGVTVDDLIKWNPGMANGFKTGDVIQIVPTPLKPANTPMVPDSALAISDTVASPYLPCGTSLPDKTFKVVLLLPFNAHVPTADDEGRLVADNAYSKNFIEFYQGFLLACDSIRKQGASVKLTVFDDRKDPALVKSLLSKVELREADLIVGPVYAECVEVLSDFCIEHQIPLVSPLSSNPQLINKNPFLFQIIPSPEAETNAVGKYINLQQGKNILLVHDGNPLYVDRLYDMRDAIFRNAIAGKPIRYREVLFNDTSVSAINKFLNRDTTNTLIVLSTSEPYISKLINKLSVLPIPYPIELIGYQDWQKFINVDIESFHQFQVQYISPFYPDYNTPMARNLVNKFRVVYNSEPSDLGIKGYSFGFLGYDAGYFFLDQLTKHGKAFPACTSGTTKNLMLSNYHFEASPGKGFENKTLWMLRYNKDFKVLRLPVTQ